MTVRPGAQPVSVEMKVSVIVFEDLQCGDCAALRVMMDKQLLPRFGGRVAFEHRDFPLPKHAWARQAAVAARYLGNIRPELGFEWRRYALENRAEITPANFNEKLAAFSKEQGVDAEQAIDALKDRQLMAVVEADYQDGLARGVVRTPTVFVNGEPYIETFTFEELAAGIDRALAAQ